MFVDHYEVLGVNRWASSAAIHEAYLLKRRAIGNPVNGTYAYRKLLEIQNAYNTLKFPDEKIIYDRGYDQRQRRYQYGHRYGEPFNVLHEPNNSQWERHQPFFHHRERNGPHLEKRVETAAATNKKGASAMTQTSTGNGSVPSRPLPPSAVRKAPPICAVRSSEISGPALPCAVRNTSYDFERALSSEEEPLFPENDELLLYGGAVYRNMRTAAVNAQPETIASLPRFSEEPVSDPGVALYSAAKPPRFSIADESSDTALPQNIAGETSEPCRRPPPPCAAPSTRSRDDDTSFGEPFFNDLRILPSSKDNRPAAEKTIADSGTSETCALPTLPQLPAEPLSAPAPVAVYAPQEEEDGENDVEVAAVEKLAQLKELIKQYNDCQKESVKLWQKIVSI